MSTNLEKLANILKIPNRSGTHRCSICNKVNNEDIETDIGDFSSHTYFVNDPSDPTHFICGECDEVIKGINQEWDDSEDDL